MIESTNSRVKPAATLAKAYVAVDKYNKKSGHVCSVNFLEQTADVQYGKEKDLDVPLSRLVIVATKYIPKLKPCTYTYTRLGPVCAKTLIPLALMEPYIVNVAGNDF